MFGIEECYTTNCQGFQGKIKQNWEDFEVREIDTNGNIAQIDGDNITHNFMITKLRQKVNIVSTDDLQDEPPLCKRPTGYEPNDQSLQHSSTSVDLSMHEPPSEKSHPTRIKEIPETYLNEVLTDTVMRRLEQLAFCSTSNNTDTICLGQYGDKQTRMKIHQCVRFLHPCLRTLTESNNKSTMLVAQIDPNYNEFLKSGIEKETLDGLFRYIHCQFIICNKATFTLEIPNDRKQRTLIHRQISKYFGSFLETKTFKGDHYVTEKDCDTSTINVRFRRKRRHSSSEENKITKSKNIYKFILCKKNVECMDAIERLSHFLKIKPSHFNYAGVKDKKALTYQFMTVHGANLEDLKDLARQYKGNDIAISNVEIVQDVLHLGHLGGNLFKIVIRDVKIDARADDSQSLYEKVFQTAVSEVSEKGFLNYFCPQRFGHEDSMVNAADIGLAMLKGEMQKAVELILFPNRSDDSTTQAKLHFQQSKDVAALLKRMPTWKTRECAVLKALKQHGFSEEGCTKALFNLPYSVRLMYVHSYSSLVWNKVATVRFKEYGQKVKLGDFVVAESAIEEMGKFHIVNEEDVVENCFDPFQIILPLPGYKAVYPDYIANVYERILQEDGIVKGDFKIKRLHLNVPGAQRFFIAKPIGMTWKWSEKDTMEIGDAIKSPMASKLLQRSSTGSNVDEISTLGDAAVFKSVNDSSNEPVAVKPIDKKNIEFRFCLRPSCYATVCLRELMKSTSIS